MGLTTDGQPLGWLTGSPPYGLDEPECNIVTFRPREPDHRHDGRRDVGLRPMRWFRSQKSPAGWAALFALGLQLFLSFGHFHGAAATSSAPAISAIADTSGSAPRNQGTPDRDDALCAICILNGLVGSALSFAPPAILPPHAFAVAVLPLRAETIAAPSRRAAFRSRAPPIA